MHKPNIGVRLSVRWSGLVLHGHYYILYPKKLSFCMSPDFYCLDV